MRTGLGLFLLLFLGRERAFLSLTVSAWGVYSLFEPLLIRLPSYCLLLEAGIYNMIPNVKMINLEVEGERAGLGVII